MAAGAVGVSLSNAGAVAAPLSCSKSIAGLLKISADVLSAESLLHCDSRSVGRELKLSESIIPRSSVVTDGILWFHGDCARSSGRGSASDTINTCKPAGATLLVLDSESP